MNEADIQKTADLLKQLDPGFLPYPIFEQIARLVALPIVEFIPLRVRDGVCEVLLIARPEDDPLFPGLLHTPGTVVRATDVHKGEQDDWQAFKRILEEELIDTKVSQPCYVGSIFHESKRGAEQAQLYWVEVLGEPGVGTFYPLNTLPDNLMESQLSFIELASQSFQEHHSA